MPDITLTLSDRYFEAAKQLGAQKLEGSMTAPQYIEWAVQQHLQVMAETLEKIEASVVAETFFRADPTLQRTVKQVLGIEERARLRNE